MDHNISNINVEKIMHEIKQKLEMKRQIDLSSLSTNNIDDSNNQIIPPCADLNNEIIFPKYSNWDYAPDFIIKSHYHIKDLLIYDDEQFVKIIYKALLKRDVDPSSLTFYLNKLRNKELTKSEIIWQISRSPEGRIHKVPVTKIKIKHITNRLSRILKKVPILNKFIFFILALSKITRLSTYIELHNLQTNAKFTENEKRLNMTFSLINTYISDAITRNSIKIDQAISENNLLNSLFSGINSKFEQQKSEINDLTSKFSSILELQNQVIQNNELIISMQNLYETIKDSFNNLDHDLKKSKIDEENNIANNKLVISEVKKLVELNLSKINMIHDSMSSENNIIKATLNEYQSKVDNLIVSQKNEISRLMDEINNTKNKFHANLNEISIEINKIKDCKDNIQRMEPNIQSMESNIQSMESNIQSMESNIQSMESNIQSIFLNISKIEQSHYDSTQQIRDNKYNIIDQQRRVKLLLEEARKRLPEPLNQKQIQNMVNEEKHILDALYVSFEDRFRGTREDIKTRLVKYIPYIEKAVLNKNQDIIYDLGCGRGEWLELLSNNSFKATGIDQNNIMVAECDKYDLSTIKQDVIEFLKSTKSNSVNVITGFHIVEHLPLDTLIEMLDLSLKALKPNGIIIFETPNPGNMIVGACNFYTDPTHINPLPSHTLEFLIESRGFIDIEIIYNTDCSPVTFENQLLNNFYNSFINVSPDYAIKARKC